MNILKRAFRAVAPRPKATPALTPNNGPRFSPGLCNELIALHDKHSDVLFSEKQRFGLKQFGTLIALDCIVENKPARALEMGAGNNLFLIASSAAPVITG